MENEDISGCLGTVLRIIWGHAWLESYRHAMKINCSCFLYHPMHSSVHPGYHFNSHLGTVANAVYFLWNVLLACPVSFGPLFPISLYVCQPQQLLIKLQLYFDNCEWLAHFCLFLDYKLFSPLHCGILGACNSVWYQVDIGKLCWISQQSYPRRWKQCLHF